MGLPSKSAKAPRKPATGLEGGLPRKPATARLPQSGTADLKALLRPPHLVSVQAAGLRQSDFRDRGNAAGGHAGEERVAALPGHPVRS